MTEKLELMNFSLELSIVEGTVKTNVDQLIDEITPQLKKYKYVVTEDNTITAKEHAANLRKMADRSSKERSRIKHQLLGSFTEPDAKLRQLEAKMKGLADDLTRGVNDVDQARKDMLYNRYEEFWNSIALTRFPFKVAFEKRYLNKTAKESEVKEALEKKLDDLNTGLAMVQKALPDALSVDGVMIIERYCETGDLPEALTAAEKARQIAEEKAKKHAEEQKRQAERPAPQVAWQPPAQPDPMPAQDQPVFDYPADPTVTRTWIVTGPKSVCAKAYQYLRESGCQVQIKKGE